MLLADKHKYLLIGRKRLSLGNGRRRGASRVAKRYAAHRGVWLFSLVAGLATATIASIPSPDTGAALKSAVMVATPPRQFLVITDIDGTVHETEHPASAALLSVGDATAPSAGADLRRRLVRVRRGDTLSAILHREGIGDEQVHAVIQAKPTPLYHLLPGEQITLFLDKEGGLEEIFYQPGPEETYSLRRLDNGFVLNKDARQLDARLGYVSGTIENSLFTAGQQAGLSDALIMRLVEIFGWDIDFALDIRAGDSFTVIHEEKYWLGQKVADGPILAAEFVNQGHTYRAIGYRDEDNGALQYYTPEGMSVKRPFLRTPVKFSRISSRFTQSRYHPVLKRWRSHMGVDYAASTGTPVRATATGRILFKGRKGGYGNTVIIRHGGAFSTLYAHLSRFNHSLRSGSLVQQGDIIGYVGKSGLATGPHLHYEFRVNDRHTDPLKYKFPEAQPISAEHKEAYLNYTHAWTNRLDIAGTAVQVATSR